MLQRPASGPGVRDLRFELAGCEIDDAFTTAHELTNERQRRVDVAVDRKAEEDRCGQSVSSMRLRGVAAVVQRGALWRLGWTHGADRRGAEREQTVGFGVNVSGSRTDISA